MNPVNESSDQKLLDLLGESGSMTVSGLSKAMGVTSTAVRQRLLRLVGDGLIERQAVRAQRGRPSHQYSLTEKARRQAGSNFADLAVVLWQQIRAVKDPEVRRGLLQRIADSMATMYAGRIQGDTLSQRMESLAELFAERRVPIRPSAEGGLPVLTVQDCPYPDLVEQDRGICAVEKMLFSTLLEHDVKLSQCRVDGYSCCQFETN